MKFNHRACLLWLVCGLTGCSLVGGEVLLDSDFNQPPDMRWTPLNGHWYWDNGAYCETSDAGVAMWSVAGDSAWTDFEIECAMKAIDSGGSLLVAGRWQDRDNHYELEYSGRGEALQINRVQFGKKEVLARQAGVVDIGGGKNPPAVFKFRLAGPVLEVAVNGVCLLRTVDETLATGRIAVGELGRRGVWDYVNVTRVPAPTADEVALAAPQLTRETPWTSFIRGKPGQLRYRLENRSKQPMAKLTVNLRLLGVAGTVKEIAQLPAGEKSMLDFPLDTAVIRHGSYNFKVEVQVAGIPVLQRLDAITIAPAPNPARMDVINWTGSEPGIESHGFTATWFGPSLASAQARTDLPIPLTASSSELLEQSYRAYNDMVARGLLSGLMIHNMDTRHLELPPGLKITGVDADGKENPTVNPNHPAFTRWAEAWMEGVMKTYQGFDALRFVNLNSEWDRSFDYSPETMALYAASHGGKEPPRFAMPVDRKTAAPADAPVQGVIADDNPYYQYLLWWWRTGQGWTPYNARLAQIVKQYRPDIVTISEPTARIPALYGKARGCDLAQDWSYAFPGPRSILLTADFLVATKKALGQKISHDVQFLWKRGWAGPEDMSPSPDVLREAMWLNLSRPMDALFMWGTYLVIQDERDPKRTVNADTYEAFRDFSENVIQPFGPMIRKTVSPDQPVAFLISTASQLFSKGSWWAASVHSMHFYDLLQAAQVPVDVILEEDVVNGVLEKRKYQAVVLSWCQTLPRGVHERLVAYARNGGAVIADQFLEAEIPGAKKLALDLTAYQGLNYTTVAAGKTDPVKVREWEQATVAMLKTELLSQCQPGVLLDRPEVLWNQLEARGRRLFCFINDCREYGEWAGEYRTVRDAGLPVTFNAGILPRPEDQVFYDLLEHREIAGTVRDGRFWFERRLPPAGGTYVAAYPERLQRLVLNVQAGKQKTAPVTVNLQILGASGKPVPGLQPVRLDVDDGAGVATEYSDYHCAEDGTLSVTFRPALNEPGGAWRVVAHDLTAGLRAEAYVTVPRDGQRYSEIKIKSGTAADSGHWDRD